MAKLSEVPKDVTRKIAIEHLDNQEDFETFKSVCSKWRSDLRDVKYIWSSKNTQLPWLMLADSPTSSYRRFYSLSKLMCRKFYLPEFDNEDAEDNGRRYFSSMGWLISVTMKQNVIHIFDVFSSKLLNPPEIPSDMIFWNENAKISEIFKFVLSTDSRSSSESFDIEVAMIIGCWNYIAFWRPGQQVWIISMYRGDVKDVCFFRGQFYSVNDIGMVVTYDRSTKEARSVFSLASFERRDEKRICMFYIVALETTLLLIQKTYRVSPDYQNYWTQYFDLYDINVDPGKPRQVRHVKGIGNRALFVGYNSTFFVEASPGGCKPNCIYFTDDLDHFYKDIKGGGGRDMGIYCLENKKVVERFYNGASQFDEVTPPMWVQLPSNWLLAPAL